METISHNIILFNHAEWLRDNGLLEESKDCFEQAKKYADLRRINKRKKYEATKLHASSNRMGNAYRIPRSA
jgi:hypothetical protein